MLPPLTMVSKMRRTIGAVASSIGSVLFRSPDHF